MASLLFGRYSLSFAEPERDVMVWPAWHNSYRYLTTRDRHFEMVDRKIYLLWGTAGVDRSTCSQWDEADLGEVLFDTSFDVADPEAQRALVDACETLPNDPTLSIKPQSTECIMLALKEWLAQPARNLTMPLPREAFRASLLAFLQQHHEWRYAAY